MVNFCGAYAANRNTGDSMMKMRLEKPSAQRDFERIGRAVALLAEHWREQPSLTWVADQIGLSEFHLQRLFSRWVGVSPKRFVQFITKEAARRYLTDASSLMDAALACGLSGSARLHDLFIRYEGMTPGEFKAAVAGQPMRWGEVDTPFGQALAIFAPRGLHRLEFISGSADREALLRDARSAYPDAEWSSAGNALMAPLLAAFASADGWPADDDGNAFRGEPAREVSPLSLCVAGSAFQLKVWEALLTVPRGQSVSYGNLASALGKPGAARAVGNAVAANTVAMLIPCHRVIRESGVVGHFRWGTERKLAMLGWEWAQSAATPEP